MKRVVLVTILIIGAFSFQPAHASWKDSVRPHIVKFLGEKWANKLLGAGAESSIQLPAIPKVTKSTKKMEASCVLPGAKQLPADQLKKYNYIFVKEIYSSTRNFDANDNDVSRWLNTLSQGATREGIYRAMVLDNTYHGLESQDGNVSDRAADFAAYFMARFLDQAVKKDALKKTPFYTLKRVVSERTLELIDELCKNPDSLKDWYAVLSGELATKYSGIWSKELRKTTSMETHRRWADAVPEQFLKSEVIIKIHKTFNSLN